jgi:dCMP deaminase
MKDKHLKAYMECAEAFAKCSVGERLKVGCVIVDPIDGIIAEGYNGLPAHIHGLLEDENNKTKPQVHHAEVNALKKITRKHASSVGTWAFITHAPCEFCATDLLDAGITRVYFQNTYRCDAGVDTLRNNGVEVFQLEKG